MEKNQISIRINLESREFEISGDIKYIDDNYGPYIKECLEIIKSSSTSKKTDNSTSFEAKNKDHTNKDPLNNSVLGESFGEYFNKFPKTLNNVDKLLIACYYVQVKNSNKAFTLSEASSLLIDQGIKLSNPNVFNKANISTKKIFKLSGNNYKVSDTGISHIQSL